jgi:hypothetical protein
MEQFRVFDSRVCYPADVMYGRIAGGAHAIVFDPHVKEVGKK